MFEQTLEACCIHSAVVAVCRELKVATGEWFLEERSKRFEQGALSSDVIKQTIMSTPYCEFGPDEHQSPGSTSCVTLLSSGLLNG